mmetsp:Transcript_84553/g.244277  ORF Transcript_84553/g.244277 Transcript_84553/m.244277 type:complete len:215 (-) Transcript_84553:27-671(-)
MARWRSAVSLALLLVASAAAGTAALPTLDVADLTTADAGDVLVRATAQVRRGLRVRAFMGQAPATPLSEATCEAAAVAVGAITCSLAPVPSVQPDGCECRLDAASCPSPPPGLGFTGISPSLAVSLPAMQGGSAILCMYWHMAPPPDRLAATAALKREMVAAAGALVKTAATQAAEVAERVTQHLWTFPPTAPPPPTPPPPLESFVRPPPIVLG